MRYKIFKGLWSNIEKNEKVPTSLTGIKMIDAREFIEKITNGDYNDASQIVCDLYAGTAYILKNALSRNMCTTIIDRVYQWGKDSDPLYKKISGDPFKDFHHVQSSIQNTVLGGYHSCEHSYYFFGWNDDELGLFDIAKDYWEAIKVLSGNEPKAYAAAIPSDGIVDRITVMHYPVNTGYISIHSDPFRDQKTLMGCALTQIGEDYDTGAQGFSVFDKWNNPYHLENICNAGDFMCVHPNLHHYVPVVKNMKTSNQFDINKNGRWYISMVSVASHDSENRPIAATALRELNG